MRNNESPKSPPTPSYDDSAAGDWWVPPGRVYSLKEATDVLTAPGMPYELEIVDIRGQKMRVFKNAPQNMVSILRLAKAFGDRTFIVYDDDRITFGAFYRRVLRVAHAFRKHGLKKGDRVAILTRNCPEWIITFWAAIALGCIVVPLNGWLKPAEIQYLMLNSEASALIVDPERLGPLTSKLGEFRRAGLSLLVLARAKTGQDWKDHGAMRFEDLEALGRGEEDLPQVEILPDDEATIFYTSGTTGLPKGALGTHRGFVTNLYNTASTNPRDALRRGLGFRKLASPPHALPRNPQPAMLLSVPLFHVIGCHSIMGASLVNGGKVVIMEKWDTVRAMGLVERERITNFGGVPALVWQRLTEVGQFLEHPALKSHDLSSITTVYFGGAPASRDLLAEIKKRLPAVNPSASNGYGLTETSALVARNVGIDYERKPDAVGPPAFTVDVKILETGADGWKELGKGGVGEVAVRGPNVVKGYWRNPAATSKSFSPSGWFRTGDIGRLDDEGFLYILDRAKDMVIRGGENVYCVEVENCLYSHPAVMDCAVVGLPHKVLGEEVGAAVQVKRGFEGVSGEEIMAWCRERLAKFKCPVFVDVRFEPLPRNAAGKVLKAVVREEVVRRMRGDEKARL
ncbi:hypothetical protein HDU96_006107 [Phlyctochytrium bullatum]|nr:hypothetical protein HDU96_006107 [Phlyctochytrium bullatum]